MPFCEFMGSARVVDMGEDLIIEGHRPHLVKGRWKQLDQVMPSLFVGLIGNELLAFGFEKGDESVECFERGRVQTVVGEVVAVEGFGMDLMHGGAGVCHRSDLIGIKFFPPWFYILTILIYP